MADYTEMWKGLGMDLAAHDALLGVLGQAYGDVFLSQESRPGGMDYFNFVMSEVHGLRIQELLDGKKAGRKVVGCYCVFVPEELVLAAGATLVGLCAGADFALDKVEEIIPRNTCALIKSSFGFKMAKVCPFLESADMVVGENTCDGKKKAYEIFAGLVDNLYVMDLPQMKSDQGRELLAAEYSRFAEALEALTGNKITAESLQEGIRLVNEKRQALHRLAALRAADPAPISGKDALLINQVAFYDDPVRFTASVNALCDELDERVRAGSGVFPKGTPRVLFSGCPMAVPNWKLVHVVETSGAVVVGEESCVGERGQRNLVNASGKSLGELMSALVDRYFEIGCAIFTPNPGRREHAAAMAKAYGARGVIHYGLNFCQPYAMEAGPLARDLAARGIPVLCVETDYGQQDVQQLKTRVEAFIEMMGA
ncbi:MAG: double-cubane-cluster-containing anaerobic reductase [Thermodesulfobacteriota bacterium]